MPLVFVHWSSLGEYSSPKAKPRSPASTFTIQDGMKTHQHFKFHANTSRLIGVNAASLVLALIANLALLLNMARRLPFAIAQSITIVGFYSASFILIGLVCEASTNAFRLDPPQEHALSQAFYYAIIAAVLYIIIASLMVVTVWGAYGGHYEKEFRLTKSQRTLMLQTIMFMIYLLLGACIYTYIEGWQFLDAVYWADFTLLTVGIGSPLTPLTHLGRGLLFPFAIGGIITIGLVVGSIRTMVLERAKAKMEARMTEKRRERVLRSRDTQNQTIKTNLFKRVSFDQDGMTEAERREQEFNIMRKIQNDAGTVRRWIALAASTFAACILWFIGALVFYYSERAQGWSYFVALYFSYTSLLTIGYGDFQPQSNSGRPFFVFWSLLAVPTLTILISNMGDTVIKGFSDLTIWLGSITVLPGEGGVRESIKATTQTFRRRVLNRSDPREDFGFEQPPGFLAHRDPENGQEKRRLHVDEVTMRRVAQHLEDEELHEATEAEREGDMLERDIHFYHYILARELRNLMRDTSESPPKQYDYSEWVYYLKLIGQDESDSDLHRKPPVEPRHTKHHRKSQEGGQEADQIDERDAVGVAGGEVRDPDVAPGADENTDPQAPQGPKKLKWSWLGTRSPLMGTKTEAMWLLERISAVLETELKRNGVKRGSDWKPKKPPISMTDLVKEMQRKDQALKAQGKETNDDDVYTGSDSVSGSNDTKKEQ